jgi:hypothetical protein
LQQNKIFKALQYQKTRTMQKQQNQIKNRVYGVFRTHHLKNTHQCTCCNQSKRLTHLFFYILKKYFSLIEKFKLFILPQSSSFFSRGKKR